jgi:pimeloyl-ACP methyl ester carboxylesterase
MFRTLTHRLTPALCLSLLSACSGTDDGSANDPSVAVAESELTPESLKFPVTLRGTGQVTINATIYRNPRARSGANVLAVHGLSETGFTFRPLAETIFADRRLSSRVKNVIGIDMPGHGDSGFPSNLPNGARFGELTIDDNVSVVIQSLDFLRQKRLNPRIVIGHSMGGLEVQATQQALLAQGSSFAHKGVFGALLLAPVPPHGQQWTQPPPADLTPLLVNDPVLGTFLQLPPQVFIQQAFGTLTGTLPANAPTPEEVVAGRYVGPEPLATVLQLVEATVPLPGGGTITLQRPTVNAGAFSIRNGTIASVVSFSQDPLVPAGDLDDLYRHLTGDSRNLLYRAVTADDAVHAMYISNPEGMLDAIRSMF